MMERWLEGEIKGAECSDQNVTAHESVCVCDVICMPVMTGGSHLI